MGNTELMKRKRAEQVRAPQVKRREPKGPASCAGGEVCSNAQPPDQGRKKLLQRPASLEIPRLPGTRLLECFVELVTPSQTPYGQLVRFKQPCNALESNRIALKREMR